MICVPLFHMTGVGYERLRGWEGFPSLFSCIVEKKQLTNSLHLRANFVFVLGEGAGLHSGAISLAPTTEFSAQHFFSRDTPFFNI